MLSSLTAESDQQEPQAPQSRAGQPPLRSYPLLSSIFLGAAAFVLALTNPVNVAFVPHPIETLVLVATGVALVAWGTFRKHKGVLFVGSAVLLAVVCAAVMTQPSRPSGRTI